MTTTPRTRVRRVFGRLRNRTCGDELVTFELTKDGLTMRRRHSREPVTVALPKLFKVFGSKQWELPI